MKITAKNYKAAPKKIFMVQFNMGGFLHDKVYILAKKAGYGDEFYYYNRSGNISVDVKINKPIYLDKLNKGNVWQYVTESEEKAGLFLLGAKTVFDFMDDTWLKYYR